MTNTDPRAAQFQSKVSRHALFWSMALLLFTPIHDALGQTVPIVDTEAPEIVPPINRFLPDSAPQTLVPAYVLDLSGIVPDGVVITDDSGNATALPEGVTGPFPPGSHTLTWSATDIGNNTTSVDQSILVFPQAYFAADQFAVPGGLALISAYITGQAVEYPVVIPFTVKTLPDDTEITDGVVLIGAPEVHGSGAILIDEDTPVGTQLQWELHSDLPILNAWPGPKTRQTITIVDPNVPPIVRLIAQQNGVPTRDIFSGAGQVDIFAQVYDLDPDTTINFDWSATDNALVPLTGTNGTSFSFNPEALVEGRYIAHVTVKDGIHSNSAELALDVLGESAALSEDVDSDGDQLTDAQDGTGDVDNDGIPNYLDALDTAWWLPGWPLATVAAGIKTEDTFDAGNIEVTWQASGFISPLMTYFLLITTDPGLELALGPLAQAGYAQARVPIGEAEAALGFDLPADRRSAEGYAVDLEVNGLSQPGQAARLTIPLIAPLPQSADSALELMVYTDTDQWQSFSQDAANSFGSTNRITVPQQDTTYCPSPVDAVALSTTLTEGDECIQVVLTDGGPNDRDGTANGRILLTMTPAFSVEPSPEPPPAPVPPSSLEGSVESLNKTETGSGGGAAFILPLLLTAAALRRRTNM